MIVDEIPACLTEFRTAGRRRFQADYLKVGATLNHHTNEGRNPPKRRRNHLDDIPMTVNATGSIVGIENRSLSQMIRVSSYTPRMAIS